MAMVHPFGVDTDTFPDLDVTGRAVTGNRVVMIMALRRLTTPYGSLAYDRDFGLDLREYLNDDLSDADLASLQAQVANEITKDERVERCSVVITLDDNVMRVRISIAAADGNAFAFTLAISEVTAEILQEAA
jgi:phage baseplate assembly protein W